MKTEYEFIKFKRYIYANEKEKKTQTWIVYNKNTGFNLGLIQWHKDWRQYCFFPESRAVFSKGCLADVIDFINQMNTERENARRNSSSVKKQATQG